MQLSYVGLPEINIKIDCSLHFRTSHQKQPHLLIIKFRTTHISEPKKPSPNHQNSSKCPQKIWPKEYHDIPPYLPQVSLTPHPRAFSISSAPRDADGPRARRRPRVRPAQGLWPCTRSEPRGTRGTRDGKDIEII